MKRILSLVLILILSLSVLTACDVPAQLQDILASLTMLEISGAVEAGAGGYYVRCGTEEMMFEDAASPGTVE